MKGIIIYEDFITDFKSVVNCGRLSPACYTCRSIANDLPEASVSGGLLETTTAICSGDDKYDFETGALIALMKMCGREKALKAVEELYNLKEPRGADLDGDILISTYEEAISEAADALTELNDKYDKAMDGLKKAKELDELREKHIEELLDRVNYWKSQVNRLCSEKHRLEEENEKLKLDCEKLKHGYIDTDMIFCGGRQNGKQYTFLVDLFKKIDQKKVDAAYKEAYNTILPVWQKEVLKQMYDIYEESKGETELPRTLDINGALYRKTVQIKDFGEESKPPTKREEMWAEIFALHKESDVIIKVKKEDVNTFLHEIENKIPEITWLSTVKIFETKNTIGDIYEELKKYDTLYFRVWKDNRLTYSSDPHLYPYRELKHITYLPPMRWDLFKKGRIYVKLDAKHFDEFKQACIRELGVSPNAGYFNGEMIVINIPKEERFVITRDLKGFKARKIINWEDVR